MWVRHGQSCTCGDGPRVLLITMADMASEPPNQWRGSTGSPSQAAASNRPETAISAVKMPACAPETCDDPLYPSQKPSAVGTNAQYSVKTPPHSGLGCACG